MVETKIQKWGNSYAVRIPKPMAKQFGWRVGSAITLRADRGEVVMTKIQPVTTQDWKRFLIPTGRKGKRNISENVDEIVYGVSRPR